MHNKNHMLKLDNNEITFYGRKTIHLNQKCKIQYYLNPSYNCSLLYEKFRTLILNQQNVRENIRKKEN